jgi:predicted peptidase
MLISTLAIAGGLMAVSAAQPGIENRFEVDDRWKVHEYRYDVKGRKELVPYCVFAPRTAKPTERYPLLFWLHWHVVNDSNSLNWLDNCVIKDKEQVEKRTFFVLFIPNFQAPKQIEGSEGIDFQELQSTVSFEIFQKTMRDYPIDPDRVCLAGVSAGCSRCWNMAARNPELYAAFVAMTGSGDTSRSDKLVNIPVWAFQNIEDQITPLSVTLTMVEALRAAGGNVYLTHDPGEHKLKNHDCWTAAFEKYDAMGWMLAQRRGAAIGWTPPGVRPWKWWHILTLPCLFLAVLRLGWHFEQRRRGRAA